MNPRMLDESSRSMTRVQLKQIKAPKSTKTWQPVEHHQLVTKIEEALNRNNLSVSKEEIAVARNGGFLFYVCDIERNYGAKLCKTKGFNASMGVMSSNNKRIAIQISVGARVEAGEGLLFSSDIIILRKKHTHALRIDEEMDKAVSSFIQGFENLSEEIQRMKDIELEDLEAMGIILKSFTEHRVLPIRLIYKVSKEYFTPSHREFKARNLWSLQNAFIIAAKELSPSRRFLSLKLLAKIFTDTINEQ